MRSVVALAGGVALAVLAGCGEGDGGAPAVREEPRGPAAEEELPEAGGPAARERDIGERPGEAPGVEAPRRAAERERAPAAAEAPAGRLYTVQVGSFVTAEYARTLRRRLEEADLPVWTTSARVGGRAFERVRVGALPDLTEARRLQDALAEQFGDDVWVAPIESEPELPPGVVDDTRRILRRP